MSICLICPRLTIALLLSFMVPLLPLFESRSLAQEVSSGDRSSLIELTEAINGNIQPVTLHGRLNESSEMLNDGSYYDSYTFQGQAGQAIAIEMSSSELDTYLLLQNASGEAIARNNDTGTETNSRIAITLPDTGTYTIIANAYTADMVGGYTLNIRSATSADFDLAEADRLIQQGNQQINTSQYQAALGSYQAALALYQQSNVRAAFLQESRNGEASALMSLGIAYRSLSQYQQAIDYYQQALPIYQAVQDSNGEAGALGNLGNAYNLLSQYQQAIDYYQQALPIFQAIRDRNSEAGILMNLGVAYMSLSQYQQAIDYYQQALPIFQAVRDRNRGALALMNLGNAYNRLGQDQQAIEYYQQALPIFQAVRDRNGEAMVLMNLGIAYESLSQYQQAIDYYQQALPIFQAVHDRNGEAMVLHNLGVAHQSLSQYQQAIECYQQALPIYQAVQDRAGEGRLLANIGYLLQIQEQPEVAIVFFKQSVNVQESIRADIDGLDRTLQQAYTNSIADDYRQLADLLLSQGRILEAQQILELLKVEELREFTRNARTGGETGGIALNEAEQAIVAEHNSLIAFGQRIVECQTSNCPSDELDRLNQQQRELAAAYNQQVNEFVEKIRDNRRDDRFFNDPNNLGDSARAIVEAQPGTMLIYPFVLEDELWLLWTTAGGVANTVRVPVNERELSAAVLQFRQLLESDQSDVAQVQATAKQLYDWLIAPLEPQLQQIQQQAQAGGESVPHLVFALDRVTRYIPMAALFDGDRYLIETHTVSTILSASLTNMNDRLATPQETPVLALGLSDAVEGFDPLPNVPAELDTVVQQSPADGQGIYPGDIFLNRDFDLNTLHNNLRHRRILHIATHGVFVPGLPDASYLMLGTGDRLTIPQINSIGYSLRDVHLVVLSACETALGGEGTDGTEIAGISSYFLLDNRAEAVLASLWLVNDASTSALMQRFYSHLAEGITKAEALRQAQLSLLTSDTTALGEARTGDGTITAIDTRTGRPRSLGTLQHPYYWAPFTLIGNRL